MPQEIFIGAGDFGFTWQFNLTLFDGSPLDLTGAASVKFVMQLQGSNESIEGDMVVDVDPTTGIVTYMVAQHNFPIAGRYICEIVVQYPGQTITRSDISVIASEQLPIDQTNV